MAPKSSRDARRAANAVEARNFAVEAYAALSGDHLTTVHTSRNETVQAMLVNICEAIGRDAEETALLYNGGILDMARTLGRVGIVAEAAVQVVAVPRPIKTVKEMIRVFDSNRLSDPARLSFIVQNWVGMAGEFVARIVGDNESSPPGTKNLRIYTPDGSVYCYANVSTHACKEQQWFLDGRPVFFKVVSFGTCTGTSVNPGNGHMTTCTCANCLADLASTSRLV